MPTRKKVSPEEAVKDLKGRKHVVSQKAASVMVKRFKTSTGKAAKAAKAAGTEAAAMPVFPAFLTFNKKAITKLLSSKECIGLRIYPAVNDQNEFTLVLVGVNEQNDNILEPEAAAAPEAKTMLRAASTAVSQPDSSFQDPSGTMDEGQASPPYPPPNNGI